MAPRFNNIPPELLRASSGWRNDKRFGPARSELESLLNISLQRRRPLYTSRRPARTDWETTSRGGFAHSDSDVVDGEATLRHDLDIAMRQGISWIPANAQDGDRVLEMSSATSAGRLWLTVHRIRSAQPRLQHNRVYRASRFLPTRISFRGKLRKRCGVVIGDTGLQGFSTGGRRAKEPQKGFEEWENG